MIVKTTKQIIKEHYNKSSRELASEEFTEEWVALCDLKKEISAMLDSHFAFDMDKDSYYKCKSDFLEELCNSSEQNDGCRKELKRGDCQEVSVSGEHNTGEEITTEDVSRNLSESGKFSPVQNPKNSFVELKECIKGVFYSCREAQKFDELIVYNCNYIRSIIGYKKSANSYVKIALDSLVRDGFLEKVVIKRSHHYRLIVQKKCTCKYFANNGSKFCGYCGGVL